jgi:hypothetical protein
MAPATRAAMRVIRRPCAAHHSATRRRGTSAPARTRLPIPRTLAGTGTETTLAGPVSGSSHECSIEPDASVTTASPPEVRLRPGYSMIAPSHGISAFTSMLGGRRAQVRR